MNKTDEINTETTPSVNKDSKTESAPAPKSDSSRLMIRLFGPLANEVGQDLADRYRTWRKENLNKTLSRAAEIAEETEGERVLPSMGVLMPTLEKASLEDDGFMRDRWASLLAASLTPEKADKVHKSFPHILEQISKTEAHLLEMLYDDYKEHERISVFIIHKVSDTFINNGYIKSQEDMEVAIDNLIRLGLCKTINNKADPQARNAINQMNRQLQMMPRRRIALPTLFSSLRSTETRQDPYFSISQLGIAFIKCCHP